MGPGAGRLSTHHEWKGFAVPAPTRFAMFLRLTAEGATREGLIQRELADLGAALGALGGSLDAAVVTLGACDAVVVGTVGSDEQLAWLTATAGSCGLVKYETLRGFSPEEWDAILGDTQLHTAHPFHS